jgi:hypothetical protein
MVSNSQEYKETLVETHESIMEMSPYILAVAEKE